MKLCLLLKSTAAPDLAVQIAAAQVLGFKRADLESFYGAPGVYVDRRGPGQQLGYWTRQAIESARKGDVVCVYDLSIFGTNIDLVAERLTALGNKGASLKLTSTGKVIKLTPDTIELLTAMLGGRKAAGKRRMDHANAVRRKNGVKVGSKPRFTDADKDIVLLNAWLIGKSQREVLLLANKALGKPISYSQIWRWANPKGPKETPWPAQGSGKVPRPQKRRRRRKAK